MCDVFGRLSLLPLALPLLYCVTLLGEHASPGTLRPPRPSADGGGGRRGEALEGQNCMRALPGPLSLCASAAQTGLCYSSSSPFITKPPPPPPPLTPSSPQSHPNPSAGNRRVQGQGLGAGEAVVEGAPSDFEDIDRHFSIVQKPRNSTSSHTPGPNCNPSTVILFNISSSRRPPKSLSEERWLLADRYVAAAQL